MRVNIIFTQSVKVYHGKSKEMDTEDEWLVVLNSYIVCCTGFDNCAFVEIHFMLLKRIGIKTKNARISRGEKKNCVRNKNVKTF